MSWNDDVLAAMRQLNGPAHHSTIYAEVRKIRKNNGESMPSSTNAIIRRVLEEHSSDSESFKYDDLYKMSYGKGRGYWEIKN